MGYRLEPVPRPSRPSGLRPIRAMATLELFGGVGEIGGNKVLLREEDVVLLLNFGTSYTRRGRFYEEYLNPRPAFGLLDPLEMGLLPPLEGLYREDMHPGHRPEELWERFRGAPEYRDFRGVQVAAIFCSHAHMDHCGYISFVREDVPIVCTLMSALIMKAVQDAGRTDFESEMVYAVPKEVDHDTGLLSARNYRKFAARQRQFVVFAPALSPEVHLFGRVFPPAGPLSPLLYRRPPGSCAWSRFTSAGSPWTIPSLGPQDSWWRSAGSTWPTPETSGCMVRTVP